MIKKNSEKVKLKPLPIKYHSFKGARAAARMLSGYSRSEPVLVYFDPDIDGLIAGYFVCSFLAQHGYKFCWYINENRQHGFMIPIESLKEKNIIAVDFHMTPDEIKAIVDSGSNIISMDHHENEDFFIRYKSGCKEGLIINNQYPFEEEDARYLSGAGVVFETLRLLDSSFDTVDNRALVGLTLLSDVCQIENPNARAYLTDLYAHKFNGYIKYLIENTIGEVDYGFGIPRLDRNYVDYTFSPIINSVLRYNMGAMAVNFILGQSGISRKCWEDQKTFVKKLREIANVKVYKGIYAVEIPEVVLDESERKIVSNFIGLVASGYLDDGYSCITYLRCADGNVGRASFRGIENGVDYLNTLNSMNLLLGVGHASAFGVLKINPSDDLFKRIGLVCQKLSESGKGSTRVFECKNLSTWVANGKAQECAVENIFCLSQHRIYLKYTGDNVVRHRDSTNYIEYSVDGISVKCFNRDYTPKNTLIMPMLERERVYFYLNKKEDV